jgi:hypothetical protein
MPFGASGRRSLDDSRGDEIGWISFGAFLIILGAIYLRTPNLIHEVRLFFSDFRLVEVFKNFWWFAPSTGHPVLYTAAGQFCYAFGLVQLGILGLRFAKGSSMHGRAETLSSAVFWLGAGFLLSQLSQGILSWLSFIAALVVLIGVSIIVSAVVLVFARPP